MTATLSILDPTAPAPRSGTHVRSVLAGLQGKVVGFIDNTKPNFSYLVDDLAAVLTSQYGVKTVVKRNKRAATTGTSASDRYFRSASFIMV